MLVEKIKNMTMTKIPSQNAFYTCGHCHLRICSKGGDKQDDHDQDFFIWFDRTTKMRSPLDYTSPYCFRENHVLIAPPNTLQTFGVIKTSGKLSPFGLALLMQRLHHQVHQQIPSLPRNVSRKSWDAKKCRKDCANKASAPYKVLSRFIAMDS